MVKMKKRCLKLAQIKWKTKTDIDIEKQKQEIATLKTQLTETDYKIVKCSEYQLAGLELPYDIQLLHTERQVIRDRINELELLS